MLCFIIFHTTGALFRPSTFELKWSTTARTLPPVLTTKHETPPQAEHEVLEQSNVSVTRRHALSYFNDLYRSKHFLSSLNQKWQKTITAGVPQEAPASEHTKQVICGQQIHLPECGPSRAKRDTGMRLSQPIAFSFTTLRISSFVFLLLLLLS